jgi:hypothetical protein
MRPKVLRNMLWMGLREPTRSEIRYYLGFGLRIVGVKEGISFFRKAATAIVAGKPVSSFEDKGAVDLEALSKKYNAVGVLYARPNMTPHGMN